MSVADGALNPYRYYTEIRYIKKSRNGITSSGFHYGIS